MRKLALDTKRTTFRSAQLVTTGNGFHRLAFLVVVVTTEVTERMILICQDHTLHSLTIVQREPIELQILFDELSVMRHEALVTPFASLWNAKHESAWLLRQKDRLLLKLLVLLFSLMIQAQCCECILGQTSITRRTRTRLRVLANVDFVMRVPTVLSIRTLSTGVHELLAWLTTRC